MEGWLKPDAVRLTGPHDPNCPGDYPDSCWCDWGERYKEIDAMLDACYHIKSTGEHHA